MIYFVNMAYKKKIVKPHNVNALQPGPLWSGINERNARQKYHESILLDSPILSSAFDEILIQLSFLSNIDTLRSEVSYLLQEAQSWIVDGVDRALREDNSNSIEEARKLLELEYLLLDFTATPDNLDNWLNTEKWNRQFNFGFGKLREREEYRQELNKNMVLPARNHWIVHSFNSHPKPPNNKPEKSYTEDISLLFTLYDLLGHASSIVRVSKKYIESSNIEISSNFYTLSNINIKKSWKERDQMIENLGIPKCLIKAIHSPSQKKQAFVP